MKKVRSNFCKKFRIYNACSKDEIYLRYNYVYFRKGYAYATNSRIAVRIPLDKLVEVGCSEDQDLAAEISTALDGYAVHMDIYKLICSFDRIHVDAATHSIYVTENQTEIRFGLTRYTDGKQPAEGAGAWNPHPLRIPEFEAVFSRSEPKSSIVSAIGFPPKMIYTIASAMGLESGIKIEFTSTRSPAFITDPKGISRVAGIIMPYMID